MNTLRIKTGDMVIVRAGKDKGKKGKVIQTFPVLSKVVVEGVMMVKKHVRPRNKGEKGQVLQLAGPISAAKVSLWCEKCGKASRVHMKITDGKKERVCIHCGTSFSK